MKPRLIEILSPTVYFEDESLLVLVNTLTGYSMFSSRVLLTVEKSKKNVNRLAVTTSDMLTKYSKYLPIYIGLS